jgi:hypothetical protein
MHLTMWCVAEKIRAIATVGWSQKCSMRLYIGGLTLHERPGVARLCCDLAVDLFSVAL